MIPEDHPRCRSLIARELIAEGMMNGIVAPEGMSAHGRGEAFDYLIGEKTTGSAFLAEKTAAAMLLMAKRPVISVNGNTAALAAPLVADLQQASGAAVEVNLFHRTEERVEKISGHLEKNGAEVLKGIPRRLLPLSHARALCLEDGIYAADTVLVPLEDGDRCGALRSLGKNVITIDINPLSRTARTATLTIVDELTRAMPNISSGCFELQNKPSECTRLITSHDNNYLLRSALEEIMENLSNALD